MSVPTGEYCHALCVRSERPVDVAALTGRLAAAGTRLWVDDVPDPAAAPAARRRRDAELARPVARCRAVLLRYVDGVSDLVLVAHRGVLDRVALGRLADGDPAGQTSPSRPLPLAASAPDWALGDGATGRPGPAPTVAAAPGDEASWIVALAVTLHRYAPDGDAVVGTDHGAYAVTPGATLGELRPVPTDRPAAAGLLWGDTALPGVYRPCLTPPFPLTFSVHRDADGPRLRCDHAPGAVAPPIAAGFTRHLAHVHRQLVTARDTPVADVELMDRREQAAVAALGRSPAELVGPPRTVHEVFAATAARAPDAVALCDGDDRWSYREVDERSARLAGGLRASGVSVGDRVGVCLDRSAELVVTLLGVLRAGAVYVPIDPAHPVDRLAWTVQDAGLRVVVTRHPGFPRGGGAVPVTPDALLAAAGPEPVRPGTGPGDPAYVIYTSGSSGRPKGVVVPHRNVVALVDATRDDLGLGPGDAWSLFHSSAFDFSVWEMWGCLLTGGRLVVVPHEVSRAPDRFRDLLARERVTVLNQTPSAFVPLLETDHAALDVRLVVFGGEPLDARVLLRWFDRHPGCRVVNMFGITETTVHVTAQHLDRGLALAATRSVGRPLPGWHVYVLDPAGRIVPPGVDGEICVGGAGVALHYLGRDDLTADRFRPDPYAPDPPAPDPSAPGRPARMYRSGDRGRLRPDGVLEHLGRLDDQVKIRGFRIEPDEIRAVLLRTPGVRSAAVVARRTDPHDPATARLDAYVVLGAGGPPDGVRGLRERAAAELPEYMVPATVTAVPALPLTVNGKLDVARLPVPAAARGSGGTRAAAGVATGATDDGADVLTALQQIWSTVLGVDVGPDDDFFELGGNSLFAIRINSAMRAAGRPALGLRELYRRPTVRSVAADLLGRAAPEDAPAAR